MLVAAGGIAFALEKAGEGKAWDLSKQLVSLGGDLLNKPHVRRLFQSRKPAVWLNKDAMDKYKPELKKFYYDPAKYKSYLEQLGVAYPPAVMPEKGVNVQAP